jgi:hypothetical protein
MRRPHLDRRAAGDGGLAVPGQRLTPLALHPLGEKSWHQPVGLMVPWTS